LDSKRNTKRKTRRKNIAPEKEPLNPESIEPVIDQLPEPSVHLDAKITEEALPEKAINATEDQRRVLFKAAAPVEAASEEPVAEICVAVEAEVEAPAEKPKAKSIFDNLN